MILRVKMIILLQVVSLIKHIPAVSQKPPLSDEGLTWLISGGHRAALPGSLQRPRPGASPWNNAWSVGRRCGSKRDISL
jgi:hypothetical protein